MTMLDWFLRKRKFGRIYSMHDVGPSVRDPAERAISEGRYRIYPKRRDDRTILILATERPLVALVEYHPSFGGGAPDMIIQAVYECDGSADDLADQLAD